MLMLLPPPRGGSGLGWLRPLAAGIVLVQFGLIVAGERLTPEVLSRPQGFAALAMAVLGLVLVEQMLRNATADARWNAKPVCLGLGAIFVFDLFIGSQAALFQRFDGDAISVRALVHAAAVPLLYVASRRHADWLGKLHVSRAAVFHSATLLLVGAYLLIVAAAGYYVRYTGGDWGRALSVALVFVALVALALLIASGSMRARLRVYISKNFIQLPLRLPRGVAALHAVAVGQCRAPAHGRDGRQGAGQPRREPQRHAVDAAFGGRRLHAGRALEPAGPAGQRGARWRAGHLLARAGLDHRRARSGASGATPTRGWNCPPGWSTSRAAGSSCRCWCARR